MTGVANLNFWHGFDRIISGLAEYYKGNHSRKAYLNIVGNGAIIEELKAQCSALGIEEYVISRIRILRYSYRLRRETYRETIVNEPIELIREQALARHTESTNPYAALVQGVDEPWDVCLLHLFMKLVQASVPKALDAIEKRAKNNFKEQLRPDDRSEIEHAFAAAEKDPSLIPQLGKLLRDKGLFEIYQDRFFALLA